MGNPEETVQNLNDNLKPLEAVAINQDLSTHASSVGGKVENVELAEVSILFDQRSEQNSTNSTYPEAGKAIYPRKSILDDWMNYARLYAESADCFLIGAVLSVVATLLSRNCWFRLDRKKYPNIFVMLSGKPGDRKTTAIKLAERLARHLLPPEAFLPSVLSVEAQFDEYDIEAKGCPDKLLIADDANSVLANWGGSSYGKMVAKQYLSLYDCGSLMESFKRNKINGANKGNRRYVPATSTSILFGGTFNIARFQRLEVQSGLRRRFLNYVAENHGRFIARPPRFDPKMFRQLVKDFQRLKTLKGEFQLTSEADDLWRRLQQNNRDDLHAIPSDGSADSLASALTEAPSHTIKIAMLFAACRWAMDRSRPSLEIDAETLQIAADHVNLCVEAGQILETIGQRSEIQNAADSIFAQIINEFANHASEGIIILSKTKLTSRFAKNPGRRGAMTPSRLYHVIIQDLIRRGKAVNVPSPGKLRRYAFKLEA